MKKIAVLAVMLISTLSMAQKMKVLEGDFKNLKGITEFNIEFDYDGIKVDKFETEEDFLADKMKKREEKGTAEIFKKNWFANRENIFEPKFISSFNKRWKNKEVKVGKGLIETKYTVKVKTVWIYPGFNVGVMKKPSLVNTIVTVYETGNPSNVLIVIKYDKAPGSSITGSDYNEGYRIGESYAKLAKTFAANIKKKAK